MAEDNSTNTEDKKKNRISIFERLNQKYGKEEVDKRIGESAEAPTGEFYRFERDEKILVKQHPVAIYSPTKFKFSDDGWGYVGSLQRFEEIKISKETGEAALTYPFGLNENQLWELLGKVKGVFPQWSSEIDQNLEILDGLLIEVTVSVYDYEKPNGDTEQRKKIRFSIAKDGDGYEAYKNRLIWLKNKASISISTFQPGGVGTGIGTGVEQSPVVEHIEQPEQPPLKF